MTLKNTLLLICAFLTHSIYAQKNIIINENTERLNWYNDDVEENKVMGISVNRAYSELLKGKKPKQKVVVAVIDGGVDIDHEDLQGKIWVNKKEIPNNKIDDDHNGYVDDIHGWNFIGNSNGENVIYENTVVTRIVRLGNTDATWYSEAKSLYDKELQKAEKMQKALNMFAITYKRYQRDIKEYAGVEVHNKKDLERVKSTNPYVLKAKEFLSTKYSQGLTEEGLAKAIERNKIKLDYYLNLDYDSRKLVGDDINDFDDRNYGNNDVKGPQASHGTSVAGVIAANRNNGIGIDGIAENVEIMVLRTTPNGDERDKDVALAIIYAVDHGAKVINMSFGKNFSQRKQFVDKAIKYAEDKGVLLVHSAGNNGENLDEVNSYPCQEYLDQSLATNWMNISASNSEISKELPAVFSNYGQTKSDVFSPGVNVISLDTNNTYSQTSGTSIAGPMVAAVAATIWSYYPDLSVQEMILLLRESSYKIVKPKKVLTPSKTLKKREKQRFSELSISGGVVNLYLALKKLEAQGNSMDEAKLEN